MHTQHEHTFATPGLRRELIAVAGGRRTVPCFAAREVTSTLVVARAASFAGRTRVVLATALLVHPAGVHMISTFD